MSTKSKRKPPSGQSTPTAAPPVELASPPSTASARATDQPRTHPASDIQQPNGGATSSPTPTSSTKGVRTPLHERPAPTLPHMPAPLSPANPEARSASPPPQPSPFFYSLYSALSMSSSPESKLLYRQMGESGRVMPSDPGSSAAEPRRPKLTDEQEKARKREREAEAVKKRSEQALKIKAKLEAARPKPPLKPKTTEPAPSPGPAEDVIPPLVPVDARSPGRSKPAAGQGSPAKKASRAEKKPRTKVEQQRAKPTLDADTSDGEMPDLLTTSIPKESGPARTQAPYQPSSAVSSDSVPTRPTTPSSPPKEETKSIYQMAQDLRRGEEQTRLQIEKQKEQKERDAQIALDKARVKPIELAQGGMVAVAVAVTAAAAATASSSPPVPALTFPMSKPSALGPANDGGSSSSVSSVASSVPPVTPTHLPKKPPASAHPYPAKGFPHSLVRPPAPSAVPVGDPPSIRPVPPVLLNAGNFGAPQQHQHTHHHPTASSSYLGPSRLSSNASVDLKGKGREHVAAGPNTHRTAVGQVSDDRHTRYLSQPVRGGDGRQALNPTPQNFGSRPSARPPEQGSGHPELRPHPLEGPVHGRLHGPPRYDQPSVVYSSKKHLPPWLVTDGVEPMEEPEIIAQCNLAIAARILHLQANASPPSPASIPLPRESPPNRVKHPTPPPSTRLGDLPARPIQSTSIPPPPVLPSQSNPSHARGPGRLTFQPTVRSPPSRVTRLADPPPQPALLPSVASNTAPAPILCASCSRPADTSSFPPDPVPTAPGPPASSGPPPPPRPFTPTYATPASSATRDSSIRATDFFLREKPQATMAELRAKHATGHRPPHAHEHRRGHSDDQTPHEGGEASTPRWIPPEHHQSGPISGVLDEELGQLGLGRYSGRKTNFTAECFVHVESTRPYPSRVELVVDRRELQLVCDLEFGPTLSIELVAPHHTRAFVKFTYVADAMKAMLASLPKEEKGQGGVLFGQEKRFVFEPRKRAILKLYREGDDGEEWADFVGGSGNGERGEDGGRAAWRKKREEKEAGVKRRVEDFVGTVVIGAEEKADFECGICRGLLSNPHLLPCCGHTFCLVCIETSSKRDPKKQCPNCRQSLEMTGRPVPNRFAKNAVDRFFEKAAGMSR